ncbi:hypothetical protein AK812_SmicGene45731, partial [Symbiodinium microadriaticum]
MFGGVISAAVWGWGSLSGSSRHVSNSAGGAAWSTAMGRPTTIEQKLDPKPGRKSGGYGPAGRKAAGDRDGPYAR